MKTPFRLLCCALTLLLLGGCSPSSPYGRYECSYFDVFDSFVRIVGYAESQDAFEADAAALYARLRELHRLYDIYHDYEGLTNLKTVNDNAGLQPVAVPEELFALLAFCQEAYTLTGGVVNVAMGPVLRLWHECREDALYDPERAALPDDEALRAAAALTDINGLVLDSGAGTAYLTTPGMRLDVGAVAKGYAARLAVEEAKAAGFTHALVNVGGVVCPAGAPPEGTRESWGIGIQDPQKAATGGDDVIDAVYTNTECVVTSGSYQRYFIVDGVTYNHIIDPETLQPARRWAAVSVLHEDAGLADVLSTALFVLPRDRGEALLEAQGATALWIDHENTVS